MPIEGMDLAISCDVQAWQLVKDAMDKASD
jgi:hypothetical protein